MTASFASPRRLGALASLFALFAGTTGFDGCEEPLPDTSQKGWVRTFGLPGGTEGPQISVDPLDNIFLSGSFSGSSTFAYITHKAPNFSMSNFLAKYVPPEGVPMWSLAFGGEASGAGGTNADNWINAIATDTEGNVLVSGDINAGTEFCGSKADIRPGYKKKFIAKFDATGGCLWHKLFDDFFRSKNDQPLLIQTDKDNNVIVATQTDGTGDFGQGILPKGTTLVAKYSPDGKTLLWLNKYRNEFEHPRINAIDVDKEGNVFASGYLDGAMDFGKGPIGNNTDRSYFVAKFAPDGGILWAAPVLTNGYAGFDKIKIDKSGDAILCGSFTQNFVIQGRAFINHNPATTDLLIGKWRGSNGEFRGVRTAGGTESESCFDLAIDPQNNILITGLAFGSIDFGNGKLVDQGLPRLNAFAAKYTTDFELQWGKFLGKTSEPDSYLEGTGIASDQAGNVIATGWFKGPTDFGTGVIVPGNRSIFLVKMHPDGTIP